MALRLETYVCDRCGKPFQKWVGGVIMTPAEIELNIRPVCDNCKFAIGKAIFS